MRNSGGDAYNVRAKSQDAPARISRASRGSCCSGVCCGKSSVSKNDREKYIETNLCELALYSCYLAISCMITYGLTTRDAYYYTNVVSNLFLDSKSKDSELTFRTSTTNSHFWEYAESTMVDGLHWQYWYGIEESQYEIPADDQAILHENKLVGRARLRQIRVIDEPCPVSEKVQANLFSQLCYPKYSKDREDKGNYGQESPDPNEDGWKYEEEDALGWTFYWGQVETYGGAGAISLLGTDKLESLQKINTLKNMQWIKRSTRAIFLEFTLHNANVNLFCIVTLAWEFPPTGGLIPSWSIRTLRISGYNTPFEYYLLVLEFFFIAFTFYYTVQEIIQMFSTKCSEYWSNVWNYVDLSILILSYLCIAFGICKYYLLGSADWTQLLKDNKTYSNFYFFGFWESQYTNAVAVLVFLGWIKLFKYISFNRTMTQLSLTMSRCAKDVGGFAVMFFIIFFAFAQLGHLLFGTTVEDFRTFYDTTFALLRLILGDFDFRAIEAANRLLGPAYFITYVFFVFFVLMNMFLAIINDTYSEVKAEIKAHGPEFEVTDYMKRLVNRLCGKLGCRSAKVDLQGQIRLANTENIITNAELRENFRNSQFSNVEIEMFLTKYELDEERRIDLDEAENLLGGLEGFHSADGRGDAEVKMTSQKQENPLKDQEISELQDRMGVLESALTNLTTHLRRLTEKLSESMDTYPTRTSVPTPLNAKRTAGSFPRDDND